MAALDQEAPLEGKEHAQLDLPETDWLAIVSEAYRTSTNYADKQYRKQWEKNISNYQGRHPSNSKYLTDAYKLRSKFFRPKTRSNIRKAEASFAEALFSTTDVISLSPVDQTDKDEDRRSEVWEAILNHRLNNSMPWFLTANGAFQETKIYGAVISRQDWQYEAKEGTKKWIDPLTGSEIEHDGLEVLCDKPRIELLEIENCRFDAAAKWYDPIGTSPYFLELMPMYVGDVLDRMSQPEDKTENKPWKKYDRGEILKYGREIDLKSSGDKEGADKTDSDTRTREFEIVWVFRCFVQKDGEDVEFYTLTDKAMLTDPGPPTSILGRPYRLGISNIEAHRCIPSSDVEMGGNLQSEANDVVNQRRDNVKLALNKGKYVRREAETDLITLKRSYPGRIVMTKDPGRDIIEEQIADVTSSAYAEEDRINNDFDDLIGGFSQGSVATNRKLNETVGGMKMLEQSSNSVVGLSVHTFVQTWVQPVLKDVVRLIQAYEDDAILQKYGADKVDNTSRGSLQKDMNVNVSVGFGHLDPKLKVQALLQSLQALAQVVPWVMGSLDVETISREIFGVIGYRDGSKFFHDLPKGPPEQPQDPMAEIKAGELEIKREQIQMQGQIAMAKLELEREIKMMELALKDGLTKEQLYSKLDLDMDKLNLNIMQEMTRREDIQSHREEMQLKAKMGSGV